MKIKFLQKNNKKIIGNLLIILVIIFSAFVFNYKKAEAAITYVTKGNFASGTGALAVGVPAGYQDGDVFLLFVESANQTITTPSGWTQVANSPQYTGTAAKAGGVRLAVFYKVVSGAQSSVSVTDSGDHTTAIIANFRGVDTTSPIHLTSGAVKATASTSISTPSLTTTIANTMIVNAVGLDKDANDTDTITTAWSNANISPPDGKYEERHDQSYNGGVGGGIAFATGIKAVAGAIGNTNLTADSSTTHVYITIALKPLPEATIPIVTTTTPVTSITTTTAIGGGNVTSNGGATVTVSGLVWNTSTNPTTALSTKTTDGWADPGLWTSSMTGLNSGTTYYVRAYATNSAGTAYGDNVQFTTLSAPIVTLSSFVSGEPGNFTVAPGGSAQVDSFGLVVSTGTDTLTGATVTLTSGMGQYIGNVALTNDGDTVTYCNASPTGDTATFTGCNLPITTTNTQYKIRLTAKSHSLMPVPQGGNYTVSATLSSFTVAGNKSGSDAGSSITTVDNLSPNGATSVSGTSGDRKNTLNWTSSNSADFHTTNGSVILRWTGTTGADVPVEGNASYVAGDTIGSASVACVISSLASTPLNAIDGYGGSAGCSTTALTIGQAYSYKVFQRDFNGNYDTGVLIGTFTPYALPALTTDEISSILGTSAVGGGNVTSDGGSAITERGIVWHTAMWPGVSHNKATVSGTTGSFTANLTGLTKNTFYYVRSYAINGVGTNYGNHATFTTLGDPAITTVSISEITKSSAIANGNITNAGGAPIQIRGFVYDTTSRSNPGDVSPISTSYPNKIEESGSFNTGSFSLSLSGLTNETTYYVRSYAYNGAGYSYGDELSFSTLADQGMPISGTLTSSVFDTANSSSVGYNSIMWKGALGSEGKVRFQFAASSSPNGPWNFYGGSTCSSGDWFETSGPNIPVGIKEGSGCTGAWNNKRYYKYKVKICSKDCVTAGLTSPVVDSIVINWSL